MTIGPEPRMQIDSMSVLRGNVVHPPLDERPRVVRAGAGFGVELERASTQLGEVEAFDRAVVKGDVRRLGGFTRAHREAVVLARDEHAPTLPLEHGVVRAAMAERELVRLVARCPSDELMPEADAQHVRPAEQL